MNEINENLRQALADRLAADHQLPQKEARTRVDDVCDRWQESPFLAEVTAAYAVVARPVFDAIGAAYASGNPHSPEALAGVVAAVEAAMPQRERQTMAVTMDPGMLAGPGSLLGAADLEILHGWMRDNGLDPDVAYRFVVREDGERAWVESCEEVPAAISAGER